jgi:hypothetical protein
MSTIGSPDPDARLHVLDVYLMRCWAFMASVPRGPFKLAEPISWNFHDCIRLYGQLSRLVPCVWRACICLCVQEFVTRVRAWLSCAVLIDSGGYVSMMRQAELDVR